MVLDGSHPHPVVVRAKELRLELLRTKAALERELATWMLTGKSCGRHVYWIAGHGDAPGHWAHAEPAPYYKPGPVKGSQ